MIKRAAKKQMEPGVSFDWMHVWILVLPKHEDQNQAEPKLFNASSMGYLFRSTRIKISRQHVVSHGVYLSCKIHCQASLSSTLFFPSFPVSPDPVEATVARSGTSSRNKIISGSAHLNKEEARGHIAVYHLPADIRAITLSVFSPRTLCFQI